ncbi:hypothetical protein KKC60_02820, partial [Patescibacteria group bacterium]|nr:hypothetical protein [Patescibacteria group bacterium]
NPQAVLKMQEKILDLATIYLSAGLNPKKCILFVQSQVPEHTELTWLLNTITPIGELERMTQFSKISRIISPLQKFMAGRFFMSQINTRLLLILVMSKPSSTRPN